MSTAPYYCHGCNHYFGPSSIRGMSKEQLARLPVPVECVQCGSECIELVEDDSQLEELNPTALNPPQPHGSTSSSSHNTAAQQDPSSSVPPPGGPLPLDQLFRQLTQQGPLGEGHRQHPGHSMSVQLRRDPASGGWIVHQQTRHEGGRGGGPPGGGGPLFPGFPEMLFGPQHPHHAHGPGGMFFPPPFHRMMGGNDDNDNLFGGNNILHQLFMQSQGQGPNKQPTPQVIIDSLQKVKIKDVTDDVRKQMTACAVCQAEKWEQEDEVMELPCKHSFHTSCILPWLENNRTCPVCREMLPGEEDLR